jgi:septum formation protein
MSPPLFVLASASPSRRRLLQAVGINPIVHSSNFDESQIQDPDTRQLVQTLAQCKAQTVAQRRTDSLILGCDSVLEMNGESYGKPESAENAIARWQAMRGKSGCIYTGHVLIDQRQGKSVSRCGITQVYFSQVDNATIRAYVQTGEPLNSAGCFALEGKGGMLIEKIEGCHSNVIGLSMPLLREMLLELGYGLSDFWNPTTRFS